MQAVSDQGVPPAVPSSTAESAGGPAGPGWADLDPSQRSALVSWLAFTATFATVRGITYSIRAGRGPFRNFSLGGEHLHHYLWGIGLLAGVGAVAVRGDEHLRQHPVVPQLWHRSPGEPVVRRGGHAARRVCGGDGRQLGDAVRLGRGNR